MHTTPANHSTLLFWRMVPPATYESSWDHDAILLQHAGSIVQTADGTHAARFATAQAALDAALALQYAARQAGHDLVIVLHSGGGGQLDATVFGTAAQRASALLRAGQVLPRLAFIERR